MIFRVTLSERNKLGLELLEFRTVDLAACRAEFRAKRGDFPLHSATVGVIRTVHCGRARVLRLQRAQTFRGRQAAFPGGAFVVGTMLGGMIGSCASSASLRS